LRAARARCSHARGEDHGVRKRGNAFDAGELYIGGRTCSETVTQSGGGWVVDDDEVKRSAISECGSW